MDGYEGPSSPRYGFTDPISAVTFEAPELPEETLMEGKHQITALFFDRIMLASLCLS